MHAEADRVYRGRLIDFRPQVILEPGNEAVTLLPRLEHPLSDELAWGNDVGAAAWELARCLLADALGETAICGDCGGTGTRLSGPTQPGTSSARAPAGYLHPDGDCSCDRGLTVTFAVYRLYSGDVVEQLPAHGWQLTNADILQWLADHSPWTVLPLGLTPADPGAPVATQALLCTGDRLHPDLDLTRGSR
jgi:hypothetical protein